MTLIEVLIAAVLALVVVGGLLTFLEAVSRSAANDQERNSSLVEQTSALHRIAQELDEAYQLNEPTKAGKYNYIDVYAWVTKPGAESHLQQPRRLVINCEEETAIASEQKCVRYETAITDKTARTSMATDVGANKRVDIYRLVDGTKTNPVFTLEDPSKTKNALGEERPTYGSIDVETPASGERVKLKNGHDYSYEVTLHDSFYMRNLDFEQ
jgi:Tfp pilus assembly protein PilV